MRHDNPRNVENSGSRLRIDMDNARMDTGRRMAAVACAQPVHREKALSWLRWGRLQTWRQRYMSYSALALCSLKVLMSEIM